MTTTDIANLALSRLGARRITDIETDETPEARSCALHFEVVRDDLLRRHHWNFALARKSYVPQGAAWVEGRSYAAEEVVSKGGMNYLCKLGHVADAEAVSEPVAGAQRLTYWTAPYDYDVSSSPGGEWSTGWELPEDCVRFIRVVDPEAGNPVDGFAIEGRQVLLDSAEGVTVVYVSNAAEIPEWDGLFVQAMTYALAHEIASDVTQNPGLAREMLQSLQQLALPEARLADAREVRSGENFGTRRMISQSALVAVRGG